MKKLKIHKKKKQQEVKKVVHCKDCRFNFNGVKCCEMHSNVLFPKDNDFCCYGEVRENGKS